jgi:hypothetical protein
MSLGVQVQDLHHITIRGRNPPWHQVRWKMKGSKYTLFDMASNPKLIESVNAWQESSEGEGAFKLMQTVSTARAT